MVGIVLKIAQITSPHTVSFTEQRRLHAPAEQTSVAAHRLPQRPQWSRCDLTVAWETIRRLEAAAERDREKRARESAGTDSQTVIEFDPKKTKREK